MTNTHTPIHRIAPFIAILALVGPLHAQGSERMPPVGGTTSSVAPLDAEQRVLHLLNRATFGVRPQDVDAVRSKGIEAWLDRQLHPESIEDPLDDQLGQRFPSLYRRPADLYAESAAPEMLQALRVRLQDSTSVLSGPERRRLRRDLADKGPVRILGELTAAKLTRAAFSERQLEEMMVDFWFDHFNVFWGKGADRWLVADYERTAIRPNVFGTFEELLVATARHPAMQFYLDNWRSMAPDTASIRLGFTRATRRQTRMATPRSRSAPAGRRSGPGAPPTLDPLEERLARLPGLNENYARELLELHTLGVEGGYTQADVVAVARAFTGWSVQMPDRRGNRDGQRRTDALPSRSGAGPRPAQAPDGVYGFVYRDPFHDTGPKTVLGRRLPAGGGQAEGLAVLAMLATHPSTAHHIATQLATRFVADVPPEALVTELEAVFLETGGDLRAVTRALFLSEHFYDPAHVRQRVKSPVILVASALRATGAEVVNPGGLIETLRRLEQAPYLAEAPTGYEESSAGWASAGAMLDRMNFGIALAAQGVQGVRVDARALRARSVEQAGSLPAGTRRSGPVEPTASFDGLAAALLPGMDTESLVELVLQDLTDSPPADPGEAGVRALGMMLGSPEFQRH